MLFYCSVISLVATYVSLTSAKPTWKSLTYHGEPIEEDKITGIVFNPAIGTSQSECVGTAGAVKIELESCPFHALNHFSTRDNRVVMTSEYDISNQSAFIPDCTLTCTDSTNLTALAWLNIYVVPKHSSVSPSVTTSRNYDDEVEGQGEEIFLGAVWQQGHEVFQRKSFLKKYSKWMWVGGGLVGLAVAGLITSVVVLVYCKSVRNSSASKSNSKIGPMAE